LLQDKFLARMPHAWDESLRLKTTPFNTASPSLLSNNWGFTAASRSFNVGASLTGSGTFSRSNRFPTPKPKTNGGFLDVPSSFSRAMVRPKSSASTFGVGDRLATNGPNVESSWNTNLEVIPGPQAAYHPMRSVDGSFAHLTNNSKKLELETVGANIHSTKRRAKHLKKKARRNRKEEKTLKDLRYRLKRLSSEQSMIRSNSRPATVPVSLRSRFADIEASIRESSKKPGPGQYNFMKNEWQQNMHKAPGIGASDRLVPAFHYRMLYKESILLARDDSYDSVGPGQFTPTLAPARTGTVGPSASCYIQNPRSLEKITFAQDAMRKKKGGRRSGSTAQNGGSLPGEALSTTWWDDSIFPDSSMPQLAKRSNPYAMYGGGFNTREQVAKRAPAFAEPRAHVLKGNLHDFPFEFGPSVIQPLSRQRKGPNILPTRLRVKDIARKKRMEKFQKQTEDEANDVESLPMIRIDDE
jgi:hypothetical protein